MSLIDLFADLSGLTTALSVTNAQLSRIADALDRACPAVTPSPGDDPQESAPPLDRLPGEPGEGCLAVSMSESPSDYLSRQRQERELALGLGFTAENPEFQRILAEMRSDLMRVRIPVERPYHEQTSSAGEGEGTDARGGDDQESGSQTRTLTADEAEAIVREAFETARQEAG